MKGKIIMSIKSLLFNTSAQDFALFGPTSMVTFKLNAVLNFEVNIREKVSDNPSKYDVKDNSINVVLKENELSAITRAFPAIKAGTYKNPGQQPGSKGENVLFFNVTDEQQNKIVIAFFHINNGVQLTMSKGNKRIEYQLFDMELERVAKIFDNVIFLRDELKLVIGYVKGLLLQACAKEEQYIAENSGGNDNGGNNWNKGGGNKGNWNKGGGNWNKGGGGNNWNKGGGGGNWNKGGNSGGGWNNNNGGGNTNPSFNNHKTPEVQVQQQAQAQSYNNNYNPNLTFSEQPPVIDNGEMDLNSIF